MKYLFILVIFLAVGWGLYYEASSYEYLSLITDYREIPKAEDIPQGYTLVLMEGKSARFFQFETATGFIDIAKHLWLIGVLIAIAIALLLPLSIYTLKSIWNWELSEAKQVKADAEKSINQYQKECDLKVKDAYDKQMKIVQNELSKRLAQVEQRENSITEREAIAEKKSSEANITLVQCREECRTLKSEFEKKEKLFTKSRNNAVAAMNRRKRKHNNKVTL